MLVCLPLSIIRPHKEERFLYPIYPLLSLAAAFALEALEETLTSVFRVRKREGRTSNNLGSA
jgi:hypothetical protein